MSRKRSDWLVPLATAIGLLFSAPSVADTSIKIEAGLSSKPVEVTSDSAVVLESALPFSELLIANPNIADISTISGTTLYVLGKQPGRTSLMLIGGDGSVMSVVDIRVSPDVSELRLRLREVLPEETIDVLPANDGLVLSGTVSSPEVVGRAVELAGHYAPGKVSNLLSVRPQDVAPKPVEAAVEETPKFVDPADVEARIREILPDEAISVHELGGTIVLSGNVSSPERAQQAVQIARLVADGVEVSNLLTVPEKRTCTMRTRRGGELVETAIPCGPRP